METVRSRYSPSGKAPFAGVLLMLLAAPFAALAATAAGALCGAILGFLFVFIPLRTFAALEWGTAASVAAVLGGSFSGFVATALAGSVIGAAVAHAGAVGKNRSPRTAAIIAAITALALYVASWQWLTGQLELPLVGALEHGWFARFADGKWGAAAWVLGALVVTGMAAATSWEAVFQHRHCEACDVPMARRHIKQLTHEDTRRVAASFDGDLGSLIGMLQGSGAEVGAGDAGLATLFLCSRCHEGQLEMSYGPQGSDWLWPAPLVASRTLHADEGQRLAQLDFGQRDPIDSPAT